MTYRQISERLGIGYDNTRKICKVYETLDRKSRIRRAPIDSNEYSECHERDLEELVDIGKPDETRITRKVTTGD